MKVPKTMKILECVVGSRLYGTDDSQSDTDVAEVFLPFPESLLGLRPAAISTRQSGIGVDKVEATAYPLAEFARLAAKCNPNVLEVLFAPPRYVDAWGRILIDNRAIFLSRRAIHDRFLGYAYGQRKHMVTKHNRYCALTAARDQLQELVTRDGDTRLSNSLDVQVADGDGRTVWSRSYGRGTSALDALVSVESAIAEYGTRTESVKKFGYDVKFAMQLVRILMQGYDLLSSGKMEFPIKHHNLLRDIRAGLLTLEDVYAVADEWEASVRSVYVSSSMADEVDMDRVNDLVCSIHGGFVYQCSSL